MRGLLVLLVLLFTLGSAAAQQDAGLAELRQTGRAFAQVARQVSPSVVYIQAETLEPETDTRQDVWPFHDELFRRFFGDDFPGLARPEPRRPRRSTSQGSGFVFASQGDKTYILTNYHVVENASRIRVRFQDRREFEARLKGTDAKSDVAVLEIEARGIPALKWGDSERLEVGEWVLAIGNPFGLSHTLTAGIVSAKGRSSLGINDYEDFIQTDAAINPGNSGGPLVNLDGEVVGMNTAIFTRSGGYMGVGFAIPSNLARTIAEQLLTRGRVVRGYIGLTVQPLTADIAEALGLPERRGVLINQVNPGSPAERAGVRPGDVLLSMDGVALDDGGQFRNRAALARPGSLVRLGLWRDGRRLEVTVRAAELDEVALQGTGAAEAIGLSVRAANAEELRRLGVAKAVVVVAVQPGSLAALAGIRPGTVILEVNRQAVGSPAEFTAALAQQEGASLLRLWDRGSSRFVTLRWR